MRIEPDGSALVGIGVQAIGQGIQSTTAAIAADALGLTLDDVSVVTGDTDLCPYGLGAWGGRGAIVTSGSVVKAAEVVVTKAKAIAAGLLEANPDDMVISGGRLHVRGSPTSLGHVARRGHRRLRADRRSCPTASSPVSRRR